jgi:hypothetical protein
MQRFEINQCVYVPCYSGDSSMAKLALLLGVSCCAALVRFLARCSITQQVDYELPDASSIVK